MIGGHYNVVPTNFGREISGPGGFVPPGTKFDTIPVLRGGENVKINADDLYVMRGLFCGEASGYAKFSGKLSLGDAIATAKDSARLLRRMSVYEGHVDENAGDCRRLPVMDGRSFLAAPSSAYVGREAKFYRRFTEVAARIGAMSFPEVQDAEAEALWVLNQAQVYCRDNNDKNVLQRMIPKRCQAASDDINALRQPASNGDSILSDRLHLTAQLDLLTPNDTLGCEMSLNALEKRYPGKTARPSNAVWTGLPSEQGNKCTNEFLASWIKCTPESQARTMEHVVPGADLGLPVGCVRRIHKTLGETYFAEYPFYDSEELSKWAKREYSKAFNTGTMDRVDVVLPTTVTLDDIAPTGYTEDGYRMRVEDLRARDNRDLENIVSGLKQTGRSGEMSL